MSRLRRQIGSLDAARRGLRAPWTRGGASTPTVAPLTGTVTHADMQRIAARAVANAPNPDWKNNGSLLVSEPVLRDVMGYGEGSYEQKKVAEAFASVVHFERPHHDERWHPGDHSFDFAGFGLAVLRDGATYRASSIIGLDESAAQKAVRGAVSELSGHFCPRCGGLNTIRTTSRRMGPEVALVTARCRCGYRDEDVAD